MDFQPRARAALVCSPFLLLFAGVLAISLLSTPGCVQAKPAVDTGADPVTVTTSTSTPTPTPGSPTPTPTPAPGLSYNQDLKAVFTSDCTVCHSGGRPSAGYSMTTYAAVMRDVVAGSASSRLVTTTQSNGSMYRYFTGNRATKADMVKRWVVDSKAAESR